MSSPKKPLLDKAKSFQEYNVAMLQCLRALAKPLSPRQICLMLGAKGDWRDPKSNHFTRTASRIAEWLISQTDIKRRYLRTYASAEYIQNALWLGAGPYYRALAELRQARFVRMVSVDLGRGRFWTALELVPMDGFWHRVDTGELSVKYDAPPKGKMIFPQEYDRPLVNKFRLRNAAGLTQEDLDEWLARSVGWQDVPSEYPYDALTHAERVRLAPNFSPTPWPELGENSKPTRAEARAFKKAMADRERKATIKAARDDNVVQFRPSRKGR